MNPLSYGSRGEEGVNVKLKINKILGFPFFHLQCVSSFPHFYATESFVDTSGGEVLSVAKELLSSRSEIVIESFTPCEPAVNKIEKRRRETNRKHKTALQRPSLSLSRLLLTRNKR